MRKSTAGDEDVWALLPIKRLQNAKSRLAPFLGPGERRSLMRAMLGDVLATLSRVKTLGGILVVTGDEEVAAIAAQAGAVTIADPIEGGVNSAVQRGIDWLHVNRKAGMMVVPADVPFVTVPEIEAVLRAMKASPVVIVPATRDGGTNIFAIAPPSLIRPAYGPASFLRHVAAARSAGVEPEILILDGAGHDIDLAVDLVLDSSQNPLSRTRGCIETFPGLSRPVSSGSPKERIAT